MANARSRKSPLYCSFCRRDDHTVEKLRGRSVSWSQIGSALGISRQAAWERFA